ncbi:MAG: hypothetical protein EOR04_11450 [Mesorhizobium sp.]|uniref:hypothetical protein n=1 Tax=Mesorhizobium sp. TaxID=1871066 RepID=UPI000FE9737A|nr:hypothetical protein [Mesorhizobium sp.]RWP42425.1 MAG: hypothetical protein EOR04_11450 [Mesorhizobium sp.]
MRDKNGAAWPQEGLEPYIGYVSTFIHLNINLGSAEACGRYFSVWMARYRKLMRDWSGHDTAIWCVRLRQSLKSTFVSTHFALKASEARDTGSHAVFYYLSYYAVLHAVWGVMYLHPDERTDAIAKPTHSKLPNVFQSAFCGHSGIIRYPIKQMMEDLRVRREYYSYRMPMNSPFDDDDDARGWTSSVGGLVKQCIQLANLHSHLISEAAEREGVSLTSMEEAWRGNFIEVFRTINSQRNPANGGWFMEPADESALAEYLLHGCKLYGHSVMFEHLSDEFMSYAGNGIDDLGNANKVRSLVYRGLF